jgi:hypothetical protein
LTVNSSPGKIVISCSSAFTLAINASVSWRSLYALNVKITMSTPTLFNISAEISPVKAPLSDWYILSCYFDGSELQMIHCWRQVYESRCNYYLNIRAFFLIHLINLRSVPSFIHFPVSSYYLLSHFGLYYI